MIVPNPLHAERHQRDEELLPMLRRRAILSGLALGAGTLVTVLSFLLRDASHGDWLFLWGPLAFGLGTFAVCFPQYVQLKEKLTRQARQARQRSAPTGQTRSKQ